ncbi:hypothetical protein D7Y23_04325 [Corallococcus sp. AB050B]|nr:hypothetical protein D7Y23_04325 [Corallococcus sp. AB050B]
MTEAVVDGAHVRETSKAETLAATSCVGAAGSARLGAQALAPASTPASVPASASATTPPSFDEVEPPEQPAEPRINTPRTRLRTSEGGGICVQSCWGGTAVLTQLLTTPSKTP